MQGFDGDNCDIYFFFTGRNEVLAKVIFSQASVCPQGGRDLVPGGLQFFRGEVSNFSGEGGSSNFSGGLQLFWGVLQFFGGEGSPIFRGRGVPPIFQGVPNFSGGFLQFFGGSPIFRGRVSNFRGGPPIFWGVLQFFGWGGWSPTPEYGQRSAGTHPTAMHSCNLMKL